MLRPATGAWVVVAGVGADVIELCDGRRTLEEITRVMAGKYRVSPKTAQADVSGYLQHLSAVGFLRSEEQRDVVPEPAGLESLALHVTGRCELACRHCYASPSDSLAEPPVKLLGSAVSQARELGARGFKLTGGDPLMRPEALTALAEPLAGCEVTVLTGGLAPPSQLAAPVVERGWDLQISLDGACSQTHDWYRGPGAHARLVANLQALVERGLAHSVTLSVCLSRANRLEVEGILQQALRWGIPRVHLTRVSRQGRAAQCWDSFSMTPEEWTETYRELADLYRRYGCRLRITGALADYARSCLARPETRGCHPGRQAMIDLDGRVYPCIMLGTPDMCLGRLQEQSLADCLAGLGDVERRCGARLTDEAVCGGCDWRMICRGACPGWPLVQGGTLMATDELCELRRQLFVEAAFQLAEELEDARSQAGPTAPTEGLSPPNGEHG